MEDGVIKRRERECHEMDRWKEELCSNLLVLGRSVGRLALRHSGEPVAGHDGEFCSQYTRSLEGWSQLVCSIWFGLRSGCLSDCSEVRSRAGRGSSVTLEKER